MDGRVFGLKVFNAAVQAQQMQVAFLQLGPEFSSIQ